jgi:hypothetical protein
MASTDSTARPIGYRAFVARAAVFAQPDSPQIGTATFSTEQEARRWVEDARRCWPRPEDFACSVKAIYGAPL